MKRYRIYLAIGALVLASLARQTLTGGGSGYPDNVPATTEDDTHSMVFDGDPSGKAVVIQSVDLGDGSRTISIRLEEV